MTVPAPVRVGSTVPLLLALLAASYACDGPSVDVVHTVRDSAGVQIVENGRVEGAESGWRVSRRPVFRTGWEDDEPTFQRIWRGVILPTGGVVVADHRANQIFEFDEAGTLVRTIGGRGEGPGEFTRLESIAALGGDSVLAHDPGQQRVSLFVGGELAGEYRLERGGRFGYELAGRLADGGILMTSSSYSSWPDQPAGWLDVPVLRASGEFARFDTLAVLPGVEFLEPDDDNPLRHYGGAMLAGGRLAYARNDRPEILWYGADGELEQVARWEPAWREFDDDMWEAFEEASREWLGGSPEIDNARLDRILEEQKEDVEGPLPLFSRPYGDAEGAVWLSEYTFPGRQPQRFYVVTAEGEWLGEVELPGPMEVLAITRDRLLAVERDEWDVQAISLYRIDRGGDR